MFSKCCIKVTPETSPIIQKLAFLYGYDWYDKNQNVSYTEYSYLFFWPDKSLCYANSIYYNNIEVDIFQLLEFLQTGKLPTKIFQINDCKVEVGDDVTITRIGNDPLTLDIDTLKEIVNVLQSN